jgi:hypothetical protein
MARKSDRNSRSVYQSAADSLSSLTPSSEEAEQKNSADPQVAEFFQLWRTPQRHAKFFASSTVPMLAVACKRFPGAVRNYIAA